MTGHQINDNKFYYIYRSTKMHTTTRAGVNVYILIYFLLSFIFFFFFFLFFFSRRIGRGIREWVTQNHMKRGAASLKLRLIKRQPYRIRIFVLVKKKREKTGPTTGLR